MPDTAPAGLHEQAVRAHAAGDRATAAALCREGPARDPGHPEAAFLLAAIAIEEGRPAAALGALDAALSPVRSVAPGKNPSC